MPFVPAAGRGYPRSGCRGRADFPTSPATAPTLTDSDPSAPHTRDHEQRSHGRRAGRNPDAALNRGLGGGQRVSRRQAAARSGNGRSALKGGAPCFGLMPSIRLADEIDCAPDDDMTATVRPDCSRSATAAASTSSIELSVPLLTGRISSNAGRSSSRESTSTEINSAPVRCDSATTAEASGSCASGKSASTRALGRPPDIHAQPASRAAGCFFPA